MDITAKYHRGADTSVQAHNQTPSKFRTAQRRMIVEALEEAEHATCEELEKSLDLKHQSVSSRITELVKSAVIRDTGMRRQTQGMKMARVYEIVPQQERFERVKRIMQAVSDKLF